MRMSTKTISYIGVLTSMSLILSYFERLLPPPIPVPGVKLGLANIIILIALYVLSNKEAYYVMLLKVVLVSLLFTSLTGFAFGIVGGTLSYIFMVLFKKTNLFSIVGVSIIGAVMFNVGQICVSKFFVENIAILYYLPTLMFFGIISGFLTGIIAYNIVRIIKIN